MYRKEGVEMKKVKCPHCGRKCDPRGLHRHLASCKQANKEKSLQAHYCPRCGFHLSGLYVKGESFEVVCCPKCGLKLKDLFLKE